MQPNYNLENQNRDIEVNDQNPDNENRANNQENQRINIEQVENMIRRISEELEGQNANDDQPENAVANLADANA